MGEWEAAAASGDVARLGEFMRAMRVPGTQGHKHELAAAHRATGGGDAKAVLAALFGRTGGTAQDSADNAWRALIDGGEDALLARGVTAALLNLRWVPQMSEMPLKDVITLGRNGSGLQRALDAHAALHPKAEGVRASALNRILQASDEAGRDLLADGPPEPRRAPRFGGKRLIITSGLPGAGKSTWTAGRALTALGYDIVREREPGYVRTPESEERIKREALRELVLSLSARGPATILWDATALHLAARSLPLRAAMKCGARVSIVSFDVPAAVAFERNAQRPPHKVVPPGGMGYYAANRQMVRASECSDLVSVDAQGRETLIFGEHPAPRREPDERPGP